MTPAEHRFSDVEGGLMRARCLVRVLREFCSSALLSDDDPVFRDGLYVLIVEADQSLNEAAESWTRAHTLATGRP